MIAVGRVAAFFDLDGTIFGPPSLERRFIAYLDEIGEVRARKWLKQFAEEILRNPRGAIVDNKHYLAGLSETNVVHWEKGLLPRHLPLSHPANGPFPLAIDRIAWHIAYRHKVFLVSGTLAPLACAAARLISERLQVPIDTCASELEIRNGCWTGNRAGDHITREAKARAILTLASRYKLEHNECFAYGNSIADLAMLEAVGRPIAVNPSFRLSRIARSRGWPIVFWSQPTARDRALLLDFLPPKEVS